MEDAMFSGWFSNAGKMQCSVAGSLHSNQFKVMYIVAVFLCSRK
jgi:hypothetical protein